MAPSVESLRRKGKKPPATRGVHIGAHPDGAKVERPNGSLSAEQLVVQEILRDALADQVLLMVSGRFDKFRGTSGDGFLRMFLKDPLFLEVYTLAQREAFRITRDQEFLRRLAGALFAKMAYIHLSSQADRPIPLPSSDTFDITRALHPHAKIISDPFGNLGLEGISVPDGYGIGSNGKIVEILEYSKGDAKTRASSQAIGFLHRVHELGNLASNPAFVELTPRKVDIFATVGRIPFGKVFHDRFESYVYSQYRVSQDAPTLLELRRQWHKSIAGQHAAKSEPSQAIFPQGRS